MAKTPNIRYFDLEVHVKSKQILEIGALLQGDQFRKKSVAHFGQFAAPASLICDHNTICHDLPILRKYYQCNQSKTGQLEVIKNSKSNNILVAAGRAIAKPGFRCTAGKSVGKFSVAFVQKLRDLYAKGYELVEMKAQYVVVWRGKESGEEVRVVLPGVQLVKKN